jgi:hypothetical protein
MRNLNMAASSKLMIGEAERRFPVRIRVARALLNGQSLYPSPGALIANNYPPLSFYIVAWLSVFRFDPLDVGRILSLAATLSIALAVGRICIILGADLRPSVFAAFWFLATLGTGFGDFPGMDDPNLLGLAVITWSFAWLLARYRAGRNVAPAIVAMVVAGFIKHNIVAIPAAALLWLWLQDKNAATRAAIVALGVAASGLELCWFAYGDEFFIQILAARQLHRPSFSLLTSLQWLMPAAIIVIIWAWPGNRDPAKRLIGILLIVSFITGYIEQLGDGVGYNAYFELLVTVSIGLGLSLREIGTKHLIAGISSDRLRMLMAMALVVRLLIATDVTPLLLIGSESFRADAAARSAIVQHEVARVAGMTGAVRCSVTTVCYRAGKQFVFDEFAVPERILTGQWSPEVVDEKIREQAIQFEAVDSRTAW